MTRHPSKIALPILAIATLMILPVATPAGSTAAPKSKTPKVIVLCLPPGGKTPVACASAKAGETILLVSKDGSALPSNITLVPQKAPSRSLPGGGSGFTLPQDWCESQSAPPSEATQGTPSVSPTGENVQGSQDIVITGSRIPSKPNADTIVLGKFRMRC